MGKFPDFNFNNLYYISAPVLFLKKFSEYLTTYVRSKVSWPILFFLLCAVLKNVFFALVNGSCLVQLTLKRNIPNNMFLHEIGRHCPSLQVLNTILLHLLAEEQGEFQMKWDKKFIGKIRTAFFSIEFLPWTKPINADTFFTPLLQSLKSLQGLLFWEGPSQPYTHLSQLAMGHLDPH